jgi:hypothetical protein
MSAQDSINTSTAEVQVIQQPPKRCKDLTGQHFGRWTVLGYVPGGCRVMWLCRCSCGTERAVQGLNLAQGSSTNCGCAKHINSLEEMKARAVITATGCWEWPDRTDKNYGRLMIKGHTIPAHRKAWEFVHGVIPDRLLICHRCDNPPCCNPDHLFLGTHRDNVRDAQKKDRIQRGARHYRATLTSEQVQAIFRSYYLEGVPVRRLEQVYSAKRQTIEAILRRKNRRRETEELAQQLQKP